MGIIKQLADNNSLTIGKLEQIKQNLKSQKEVKRLELKEKSDSIAPKIKKTFAVFSFLSLFTGKKKKKIDTQKKSKKKSFPLVKGLILGYQIVKKILPKKKK